MKTFSGTWAFMSNFTPAVVVLAGEQYPTTEHAYQAAKTLIRSERDAIRKNPSPGWAKRHGRQATLRPCWDEIRLPIMEDLQRQKYAAGPDLAAKLLATGDAEIVEDNSWHDNFFGDCHCLKCENIVGKNHLGKILMRIREELK